MGIPEPWPGKPEYNLSQPEHTLRGHFSVQRGSFWLPCNQDSFGTNFASVEVWAALGYPNGALQTNKVLVYTGLI